LRGGLREDPDIILVGEMRDLETIQLALEAAETGHLVFATLHTISASKTVDRIIEVFPGDLQSQVRSGLADSLRAIIAQTLFKRVDKPGRVAALEVLIATPAVRNLIREEKVFQINSVIETGRKFGMQPLDDAIMRFLRDKVIDPEEAYSKSVNKAKFRDFLSEPPQDFTEV
jgi:twitching motility protein PilT